MFEVLLRHREYITRVSEEHIAPLLVLGHILIFALLEVLQLGIVITLYPAGLIEMYRLPAALGVILILQAILDHLELQLTDSTNDLTVVELIDEQLGHTFIHQLVDTLLQLFRLHRVVVLDILEQLRRERGQSAEMQLFALRQRVTYFKYTTRIRQANDISRPRLIDGRLTLSHKLCG